MLRFGFRVSWALLLQAGDGDKFGSAKNMVADAECEIFHATARGAELAVAVGGDDGAHGVRVVGDDAAHGFLGRRHRRLAATHFLHRQKTARVYEKY